MNNFDNDKTHKATHMFETPALDKLNLAMVILVSGFCQFLILFQFPQKNTTHFERR